MKPNPPPRSDPAEVAARLRRAVAEHAQARGGLMREASDVIRLAEELALAASAAYRIAYRMADAAGDHGAAVGRLRRDARRYERGAERMRWRRCGAAA
jgi:hypothetical protein